MPAGACLGAWTLENLSFDAFLTPASGTMRRGSPCAGSQCGVWELLCYTWYLLYKNRGYKKAYTQLKQFFLSLKKLLLIFFTDLTPLLVGPKSESCSVGHWRGNVAPQLERKTAAAGTCAPLPSSPLSPWVTLGTSLNLFRKTGCR